MFKRIYRTPKAANSSTRMLSLESEVISDTQYQFSITSPASPPIPDLFSNTKHAYHIDDSLVFPWKLRVGAKSNSSESGRACCLRVWLIISGFYSRLVIGLLLDLYVIKIHNMWRNSICHDNWNHSRKHLNCFLYLQKEICTTSGKIFLPEAECSDYW